jgi:hypothetical protein
MSYQRYTPEQLEKIEKLREAAEGEQKSHQEEIEWLKRKQETSWKELEVGDRVYVVLGGLTIIGYLVELHKEKKWLKWSKTIKQKVVIETFDVSTPYGKLKKIERKNLRYRHYEDLSHVEIPEAIKEISTQDLLAELTRDRTGYYGWNDDGHYSPPASKFTSDQVRAELRNRPNVRRHKKVKKALKKFM